MTGSPENIMKQLSVEEKTGDISISAKAAPALCTGVLPDLLFPEIQGAQGFALVVSSFTFTFFCRSKIILPS